MRLPLVDLLRILSALAVMVFHWTGQKAGPFNFGWLGVEQFFMISGYVIALTMQGRTRAEFITARARRLWPTFAACLLLTLLVAPPTPAVTVIANLTMIPAILGFPYVDSVYWSLMFEIMFYAAVFVIVPWPWLLRPFAWAWLSIGLLPLHPPFSTLLIQTYAPFFIIGIAIYCADWLLFGIALCIAARWGWIERPLDGLIIIACAFALLGAVRVKKVVFSKALYVLGGISYPLYLLHDVFALQIGGAIGVIAAFLASFAVWQIDRLIKIRPTTKPPPDKPALIAPVNSTSTLN